MKLFLEPSCSQSYSIFWKCLVTVPGLAWRAQNLKNGQVSWYCCLKEGESCKNTNNLLPSFGLGELLSNWHFATWNESRDKGQDNRNIYNKSFVIKLTLCGDVCLRQPRFKFDKSIANIFCKFCRKESHSVKRRAIVSVMFANIRLARYVVIRNEDIKN